MDDTIIGKKQDKTLLYSLINLSIGKRNIVFF